MILAPRKQSAVSGEYVTLDGECYYRIANSHLMPDFFMSLVGASDHWMFVSSNGSLTAGRRNADNALFPYATDDQLSAARGETGSTTLVRLTFGSHTDEIWEPFSLHDTGDFDVRRNLYKTPLGNKLIFEEINETLGLSFRYRWAFSEKFGFVRTCRLENRDSEPVEFDLLDGLRNVLPYGVASEFMMRFSNLGNAYKKSELIEGSNLGLYVLSSIPTDRAEPSEALKATTVWQTGLNATSQLLSPEQLSDFRSGATPQTETDVRGRAGAFLVTQAVELGAGESIEWHVVAELAQDHADVIALHEWLTSASNLAESVTDDISASEANFLKIVSSSDGRQCTANARRTDRHQSNTVFNVMRGGLPLDNYQVQTADFVQHIANFNKAAQREYSELLDGLPATLSLSELKSTIDATDNADLIRLTNEYLPLAFSRRHGDPTRPWNRFSIDLRSGDGGTNLNYQGNWRDIFQNWEALAVSFPEFSTAMICRFVNATTADGYNPYKVTKNGFDWEAPSPHDPWANIGYWGDHQIIYLLRLLEANRNLDRSGLDAMLTSTNFVHANVPYRIKPFSDIKRDPQDTIEFDFELARAIDDRVDRIGADGKLLQNVRGEIHRVTLLEKLLTLSLAKLSNFVPDGGIWLNTQRPEWNDANNALVGNGLSMVTTYYLHRWFRFLHSWLSEQSTLEFEVSAEVADFFQSISKTLRAESASEFGYNDAERADVVTALSDAGSDYRSRIYESGVAGNKTILSREECLALFETARQHLEATIRNNRRDDGLYHAYNLLDWRGEGIEIHHLYEMLEGQVAVLSSGLLSADETVQLLDAMRTSRLYRANQHSYMLYPDRQLPRFLDRNTISEDAIERSPLLQRLLDDNNEQIVRRDVKGRVHFSGEFRNANDLTTALSNLSADFASMVEAESDSLTELFEDLFNHRQFTGRSGTFFAYEGLGSIYWHMVSKLALAVCESFFEAIDAGADAATIDSLRNHFQEIRAGIGAEKSPTEYGAFASDAYSHTPENAGVKQPGMTGQVKEDILSRFAELGVHIDNGCLAFRFDLFEQTELLAEPRDFSFCDLNGEMKSITVPVGSFAMTLCQVPILVQRGDTNSIQVGMTDGGTHEIEGLRLDERLSSMLFSRSGEIAELQVSFTSTGDSR